jgi:hypothetical protein
MKLLVLAGAALLAAGGPAFGKDEYVYGPPPDWERYKQLGEAAVRARLPEPDSFRIEWPNSIVADSWRHKGRFHGYLTCGELRTTSPIKGFRPLTRFVVVIDYDQVKTVDISQRVSNSLVNVVCNDYLERGVLEQLSRSTIQQDVKIDSLGLKVRIMPEGAYVIAVETGSAGLQAGLTPGMVLTHANGISLAGLGTAMVPVLSADTPVLALETAAGDHINLNRAP